MSRLAVLTLAVAAGCSSGAPPPTDVCAAPSAGSADTLEVGAATKDDLAGLPTTFTPLADGDGVPLIRGAQGAYMVGFILHVSGASAPACLDQHTVVSDGAGARVTSSVTPVGAYAQPDGTRLTRPLWLPADYPLSFVVDVSAASQSLERHLHLITQ